jgi:hypothetical protein
MTEVRERLYEPGWVLPSVALAPPRAHHNVLLLEFVPRLESPSKDPSSSQPSTVTSLERYPRLGGARRGSSAPRTGRSARKSPELGC